VGEIVTPHEPETGPGGPLSASWLDELAQRLAEAPPVDGARLALGQVITGPTEQLAWTVSVGGGEPAQVVAGVGDAQVCLVSAPETARRLWEGVPPGQLLEEGRLKLRGDVSALVGAQDTLAHLAEILATGGTGPRPIESTPPS